MLIEYLTFYLIFIIIASLLVSLIVLRLKFPSPQVVIPLVIALILVPAPVGYVYVTYFNSLPETSIPDLSGLTLDTAMAKLESLDLKGRHAGSVYDMKYPEGRVVSQRPEAGRKVKVGRLVSLLTSSGRRRTIVPNLLGRPAAQIEEVLAAKGLLLGEVRQDFMPELDPGIVLTQSPLPGEEVDVDSAINVTVSSTAEAQEPAGTATDEGGFRLW
ncbi:MAG: PASTA domain-containing protein [Candidatus Margulisbacteria bacterium]|nr:PASTA domain-containing protein [Candidatus Margulisiibacteriota bacterium]